MVAAAMITAATAMVEIPRQAPLRPSETGANGKTVYNAATAPIGTAAAAMTKG
jgi:hypothetical protein